MVDLIIQILLFSADDTDYSEEAARHRGKGCGESKRKWRERREKWMSKISDYGRGRGGHRGGCRGGRQGGGCTEKTLNFTIHL